MIEKQLFPIEISTKKVLELLLHNVMSDEYIINTKINKINHT